MSNKSDSALPTTPASTQVEMALFLQSTSVAADAEDLFLELLRTTKVSRHSPNVISDALQHFLVNRIALRGLVSKFVSDLCRGPLARAGVDFPPTAGINSIPKTTKPLTQTPINANPSKKTKRDPK